MPRAPLRHLAFVVLAASAAAAPDARVTAETELLKARAEVATLRQRLAAQAATDERVRLEAEAALRAARLEAEGAAADAERLALGRAAALDAARASALDAAAAARKRAEQETALRLIQAESSLALAKADTGATLLAARRRLSAVLPAAQIGTPSEPLVDGTLRISDRRIPLNGPVTDTLAAFVCERIAFHNARDGAAPIFLVIDNSPGGSVMAGYQILRAMETSRAPVHVVVKGSAASMAAVITTLARRSFVYPGTLLMHHQPSFGMQGNLRELQERFDWSKAWCDRINREVAGKMGLSLDDFVRRMYAASVTGDWRVTGEEAVRLRWATDVVERIREDGITELISPADAARVTTVVRPTAPSQEVAPPPLPGDAWLIHEPASPLSR